MSTNYVTPIMGLTVPIPGLEPGPQYANDMSSNMSIIDGYGAAVTPARLNINADLGFQSHNITNLRSLRMVNEGGTLIGASDLNCIYVDNGNLYFNNAAGVPIELTVGNGISPTPLSAFTIQLDNAAIWTMIPSDTYNILDVAYSSTGTATINLAATGSLAPGRFLFIKDISGNATTHSITVNVAGGSGDLIDGASSLVINSNYASVILWTDGAGHWYILGNSININGTNGLIHLSNGSNLKTELGTTVLMDGYVSLLGTNIFGGTISLTTDVTFAATVTTPSISQLATTGTAQNMTISAQGTSATSGGDLNLQSGAGSIIAGSVNFYCGAAQQAQINSQNFNYRGNGAGGSAFSIIPWEGTNAGQYNFNGIWLGQCKTLASGSNVSFFTVGIPVPSGTFSFIEFSWIRRAVNAAAENSAANKGSIYVSNLGGVITMGAMALAYPASTDWDLAASIDLSSGGGYVIVKGVAQSVDQYWQMVATVHTC